jgi:hypothetical protein
MEISRKGHSPASQIHHLRDIQMAPSHEVKIYALFQRDTSTSLSCDQNLYHTLVGSLIYTLCTRYDIQKEVVNLCSKNSCPTDADLAKKLLLLSYLAGCPKLGPIYLTTSARVFFGFLYGKFVYGLSHAAFSLHIRRDSALFHVSLKKQSNFVAVGFTEGK